jgi:hypothetical protein
MAVVVFCGRCFSDSRSTSSGGGVLLQMDLDRASIKEASEQPVDNMEPESADNE